MSLFDLPQRTTDVRVLISRLLVMKQLQAEMATASGSELAVLVQNLLDMVKSSIAEAEVV